MKRALALFTAVAALAGSATALAGPSLTASIYAPDIEIAGADASPDGLLLDLRAPLNKHFWIGGTLTTTLNAGTLAPGVDVELGTSVVANLGVQTEFSHNMFGYAYLGYGAAKVLSSGAGGDLDGKGVAWGLGMQFVLGDMMLVDAGYATLFDGDMDDASGTSRDTTIAGPRVGLGVKF